MKPKRGFLKAYLIIALIYGALGLIDNGFAVINHYNNIFALILAAISFLFLFFNIFSLVIFRYHRVEKIAYVLPIYHLFSYSLFLGLGVLLAFLTTINDWVWISIVSAGIIFSFFEVIFSLYLLKRITSVSPFEHR